MTGFPLLRPPRQSPATAYLQHLQQKKGLSSKAGPYAPLAYGGCGSGDDDEQGGSSPQSVVLRKVSLSPACGGGNHGSGPAPAPPAAGPGRLPKPTLGSRSRSAQTFATCGTLCSDPSSDERTEGEGNSANSNSSLGETAEDPRAGGSRHFPLSFPDDFVASTGAASLTTAETTAIVPRSSHSDDRRGGSSHRHLDDATLPSRDVLPSPSSSAPSPSRALSALLAEGAEAHLILDDVAHCHSHDADDDDSLVALDRLLAETSRRWSESTRQTHREFCRLSNCPCREQESIIARQAAEIAHLREQLQQAEDEAAAQVFPLEQIEVYHDRGDDHCSVTSGLTQHYDTASIAAGQQSHHHQPPPPPPAPECRPDADSVTGTQSVHLAPPPQAPTGAAPKPFPQTASKSARKAPLLPPSNRDSNNKKALAGHPLRARNRLVSLTAADGTTRQAVYTGDVNDSGVPDGCGVLKFATGDYYMGQLQGGQMHGQGTFVVNRTRSKASSPKNHPQQEVLKGHFERNVFTG